MSFTAGKTVSVLQMYELVRNRMMELSQAASGAAACLCTNNLPFQLQAPGLAFSPECRPEGISFILPPCAGSASDATQSLQGPFTGSTTYPNGLRHGSPTPDGFLSPPLSAKGFPGDVYSRPIPVSEKLEQRLRETQEVPLTEAELQGQLHVMVGMAEALKADLDRLLVQRSMPTAQLGWIPAVASTPPRAPEFFPVRNPGQHSGSPQIVQHKPLPFGQPLVQSVTGSARRATSTPGTSTPGTATPSRGGGVMRRGVDAMELFAGGSRPRSMRGYAGAMPPPPVSLHGGVSRQQSYQYGIEPNSAAEDPRAVGTLGNRTPPVSISPGKRTPPVSLTYPRTTSMLRATSTSSTAPSTTWLATPAPSYSPERPAISRQSTPVRVRPPSSNGVVSQGSLVLESTMNRSEQQYRDTSPLLIGNGVQPNASPSITDAAPPKGNMQLAVVENATGGSTLSLADSVPTELVVQTMDNVTLECASPYAHFDRTLPSTKTPSLGIVSSESDNRPGRKVMDTDGSKPLISYKLSAT
eukprot:gnl/MRDRNA2_/MRDRNA2_33228_c0_seq1.p1 gnl/MRDRNA2_/MRDRNA2_33228_c0~~gnl/MRDRNA2_/MRDRNA2_33228_c0_seq1.p1  ORF type:complete len:616 (+),score=75.34 gnl/MRDRNA2_/MRDRNA2_33228_c0_seq1:272-1849(+)